MEHCMKPRLSLLLLLLLLLLPLPLPLPLWSFTSLQVH